MSEQRTGRHCSRQTCSRDAVCTLTYVYADSTAVIGALSARSEPHAYDLCGFHADRMTAPRGWRVVRLDTPDDWDRGQGDVARSIPASGGRQEPDSGDGRARTNEGFGVLRDVSLPRSSSDQDGHRPEGEPDESGTPAPKDSVPWNSVPLPDSLRTGHIRRP